jgi:adenylyl cyclase-associated protein
LKELVYLYALLPVGLEAVVVKMSLLIEDYERWIQSYIVPLIEAAKELGDADLMHQMGLLSQVVAEQRNILQQASQKMQPEDEQFLKQMAKPMSDSLAQLVNFAGQHRISSFHPHLSAISEGSFAFNWIFVVRSRND